MDLVCHQQKVLEFSHIHGHPHRCLLVVDYGPNCHIKDWGTRGWALNALVEHSSDCQPEVGNCVALKIHNVGLGAILNSQVERDDVDEHELHHCRELARSRAL